MEKEFEDSFEKVYENISKECFDELKKIKSKHNSFTATSLIILIVINLIFLFLDNMEPLRMLAIVLSIIILLLILLFQNQNYRKIYKIYLINGLLKQYNKNYIYEQTKGVSSTEYAISKFDVSFDEFYSEDKIYGTLDTGEKFQTAEVITKDVSRYIDQNGNTRKEETVLFRGIFGIVYLKKSINSNIYVLNNSHTRKFSQNRVEVDSSEFEKYYDCITDNKIKTMQIFTSDLIEKYIDIIKENKNGFELKVDDNMMFFRYKCGKVFEPPIFRDGLNKEFVKKYYKLIYFPLEIMTKTVQNINEVLD